MFRHLLAATVAAAGIGLAGTADTAQAGDRHRGHDHDRGHDHHRYDRGHHHGHYHGDRGRFRIQPYRYHGRSGFGRGYYGGSGGFYGRPYYGGSGFYIGTNRFQLGIFR
jgi:hypothetical protein